MPLPDLTNCTFDDLAEMARSRHLVDQLQAQGGIIRIGSGDDAVMMPRGYAKAYLKGMIHGSERARQSWRNSRMAREKASSLRGKSRCGG